MSLRQSRDQEDDEPQELGDDEPDPPLGQDDLPQVERAGEHDDPHQRQAHEDLVAEHLGG